MQAGQLDTAPTDAVRACPEPNASQAGAHGHMADNVGSALLLASHSRRSAAYGLASWSSCRANRKHSLLPLPDASDDRSIVNCHVARISMPVRRCAVELACSRRDRLWP